MKDGFAEDHQQVDRDWEDKPEVIDALKRLDDDAWRRLFRTVYPILISSLYKMGVPSQADAEDRAQDTLAKAIQHIDSFELQAHSSLIGWIITIADRVVKDWVESRNAKKRGEGVVPQSLDAPAFADSTVPLGETLPAPEKLDSSEMESVREAVIALWTIKPKCAQVLELKIFDELQFNEIAVRLGIKEETAKSRYYQCALPEITRILREMQSDTTTSGHEPFPD